MKKLLSIVLSGLLLMSCVCLPVDALASDTAEGSGFSQAEPSALQEYGDFQYTINADRDIVTIISYQGTDENVTVPSEIESVPVKIIARSAFHNNESIKIVVLPDTIMTIKDECFLGCSNLESINFPEGLVEIGSDAFVNCTSLNNVELPKSLEVFPIGGFAFCTGLTNLSVDTENEHYYSENNAVYTKDKTVLCQCAAGMSGEFDILDSVKLVAAKSCAGCQNLTSVDFSENLEEIGEYAFFRCTSLSSIVFHEGLKRIGDLVFIFCEQLSSVDLPDSIEMLGELTFSHIDSLTGEIRIPKNLTYIGTAAFIYTSVSAYEADPENPVYTTVDGTLFTKDMRTLVSYPGGRSGDYVIPETVTRIEDNAFTGSKGLTSVVISDNVTYVGDVSFVDCSSLSNVTFGKSVEYIGSSSFSSTAIKELQLPDSLKEIAPYAFFNCTGLTEVVIPRGVTSLSERVFSDCTNLKKVTLYETVTYINGTAFGENYWLTIFGYSGTYAEEFALAHNYTFVSLGDIPVIDTDTESDTDTSEIETNDEPELYGDVNNDGKVTAKDSMTVQRYAIKLADLTDEQFKAADVDKDNKVTSKDALYILRCSINLEVLPIN